MKTSSKNDSNKKTHVFFLREDSIESTKVEQSLLDKDYSVTSTRDLDAFGDKWHSDDYHILIIDHAWPFEKTIALLDSVCSGPSPVPIIMMFENSAIAQAQEAKMRGVEDYVILDQNEEYLSQILALVDVLVKRSRLNMTMDQSAYESSSLPTDFDLNAIANEIRTPPPDNQTLKVIVLAGPDQSAEFQTDSQPCLVGRDPSCHLALTDNGISRFHARFKLEDDDTIVVNDLQSRNGTYIDGNRINCKRVNRRDKIQIGHQTIIAFR